MTIKAREYRVGAKILTAVAALVLTVTAPVAIDLSADDGLVSLKAAAAKGNGGGNGGGNAGGNGKGKGKGKGGDTATTEGGDTFLLLLVARPGIEMAVITTEIRKRYPADEIATLDNPHKAISFFTEIRDMSGTTVTHRWFYKGKVEFQASFNVMSKKWRVWSTQLLPRDKPGLWSVQILDQDGNILETRTVDYQPATPQQLATES
jgi:hypothetical protein